MKQYNFLFMFYRLLLFIFALIMHILFTLCKIGDRGGHLNHLMKIKRRWTFKLRERPIKTRKAKKPQLLTTKLLSAAPFCPATSHKPGSTDWAAVRWDGDLRRTLGTGVIMVATLGRPGLQPAPVSVWQRKAQIIAKTRFLLVCFLLVNTLLYTT